MKDVLYPGSFDPVTNGHKDVVDRISPYANKIVAAIGVNPSKAGNQMFSLQERMQMMRQVFADNDKVDVVAFRGMLTDFCYENNLWPIMRGIRNSKDFDMENELQMAIARQGLWIETFFLPTAKDKPDISSTMVKGILKEQGDKVYEYVPLNVKQALEGRMLGQYMVWLTGTIGSGKSYATAKFIEIAKKNWIPVHNLDLDEIGHEVIWPLQEPVYQKLRSEMANIFWQQIQAPDGSIIRSELGKIVFSDPLKMKTLNEMMATPMKVRLRRQMYNKSGVMFYNAALIAEAGSTYIPNNNILLMDIDPETQAERLRMRNHSDEEIQRRVKSQFSTQAKADIFEAAIAKDKRWSLIKVSWKSTDAELEQSFNAMLAKVDSFWELRFEWLMNRLGTKENPKKLFAQLRDMYDRMGDGSAERDELSQKMKWSYHKRLHVVDCMNELYEVKHLLDNPDAVECALLFHDIVYDPLSKTNEEDSTVVAEKILTQRWLPKDFIARVKQLILATKHDKPPTDNDMAFIMDIDMSILGKDKKRYVQYMKDVRREYYAFSDEKFNQWRESFLLSLHHKYKKSSVFHTPYFQEKYDTQAKGNITWEIMDINGLWRS